MPIPTLPGRAGVRRAAVAALALPLAACLDNPTSTTTGGTRPLVPTWSRTLDATDAAAVRPLLLADGDRAVLLTAGGLRALRMGDGVDVWSAPLGTGTGTRFTSAAVADENVYVLETPAGALEARATATGTSRWRVAGLSGTALRGLGGGSGVVVVVDADGAAYGREATTGAARWTRADAIGASLEAPAVTVTGNGVLVAAGRVVTAGTVQAPTAIEARAALLDATTGAVLGRWSWPGQQGVPRVGIVPGLVGSAVVGANLQTRQLIAYPTTGTTPLWSLALPSLDVPRDSALSRIVADGPRLFVWGDEVWMRGVTAATGAPLWGAQLFGVDALVPFCGSRLLVTGRESVRRDVYDLGAADGLVAAQGIFDLTQAGVSTAAVAGVGSATRGVLLGGNTLVGVPCS